MATTYYWDDDASDLSPFTDGNLVQSTTLPTQTSTSIEIAASATESWGWITPSGVPNNDAWEDGGTQTTELHINAASMSVTARCRVVRLTSAGSVDQAGSFTGTQTMFGASSFTFSPVSPTWSTTEDCSHRYAINFEFANSNSMAAETISVVYDDNPLKSHTLSDISENAGGCAGGARTTNFLGLLGVR